MQNRLAIGDSLYYADEFRDIVQRVFKNIGLALGAAMLDGTDEGQVVVASDQHNGSRGTLGHDANGGGRPSMFGILTSKITTSGTNSAVFSNTSKPSDAVPPTNIFSLARVSLYKQRAASDYRQRPKSEADSFPSSFYRF